MEKKERVSFHNQIAKNKRDSVILILVVFAVLLALVYTIGFAFGGDFFWMIIIFGTIISIIYVSVGYTRSSKIALWSVNAKPADPSKYSQYHHLVEGLCLASGMPKPKLYVMENPQINAFATGKNPKESIICVTTGCLEKLNKQELEGVLAHELSHIANYDIRFMTLTAILVGLVAIIAQVFLRSLFWSSMFGGRSRNSGGGKGGIIIMVVAIILAILAPIFVMIVQLAISRRREYSADASAVKFIRSPTGLIGALEKIKHNSEMKVPQAVAPLFLSKPAKTSEIFSTHPPLSKRIEVLKRM
jgi:heat shock protein HtpX